MHIANVSLFFGTDYKIFIHSTKMCPRNVRGQKLFNEVVADLAAQNCEISQHSAINLHNALSKEHQSTLSEWKPSQDVPVRHAIANNENELLACRGQIDPSTWICKATNIQLHTQSLDGAQREQLYDDILDLGQNQSTLVKELRNFSDWME